MISIRSSKSAWSTRKKFCLIVLGIVVLNILIVPYYIYHRSTNSFLSTPDSSQDFLEGDDFMVPLGDYTYDFSVVIPVYNAAEVIGGTLGRFSVDQPGVTFQVIMIDDNSDQKETREVMRTFSRRLSTNGIPTTIILNDERKGFSYCVNRGVKAAKGQFILLLNADAILPTKALPSFLSIYARDEKIGLVGPLSNAASYQGVPDIVDREKKTWSINPMPDFWETEMISKLIPKISERKRPVFPFLNGFCFSFRRDLFSQIGSFDYQTFGLGYGEENDFVLRARKAGYSAIVDDSVYVYHHKTASYTPEERTVLAKNGGKLLQEKHGVEYVKESQFAISHNTELDGTRSRLRAALAHLNPKYYFSMNLPSLLFLLPSQPTLSEPPLPLLSACLVLMSTGSYCQLAMPKDSTTHSFLSSQNAQTLVRLYSASHSAYLSTAPLTLNSVLLPYTEEEDLALLAPAFDAIIATSESSDTIRLLTTLTSTKCNLVPSLFLRDYSKANQEQGLALPPNTVIFTDNPLIQKQLQDQIYLQADLVDLSIDFLTYSMKQMTQANKGVLGSAFNPIQILVLLDPAVSASSTQNDMDPLKVNGHHEEMSVKNHLDLLIRLESMFPQASLEFHFLGLEAIRRNQVAFDPSSLSLPFSSNFYRFPFEASLVVPKTIQDKVSQKVLSPSTMAELLSRADLFVDFSAQSSSPWITLQAMLFGSIPILFSSQEIHASANAVSSPLVSSLLRGNMQGSSMKKQDGFGGNGMNTAISSSYDNSQSLPYLQHDINSFILSSSSSFPELTKKLIESPEKMREMRTRVQETALAHFGPEKLGTSLASLFSNEHLNQWRLRHTNHDVCEKEL